MIVTVAGEGAQERQLHALRLGVAVLMIGTFLAAVGLSLTNGSQPPLVLVAPTMLVLGWLYRVTKQGEDGQA